MSPEPAAVPFPVQTSCRPDGRTRCRSADRSATVPGCHRIGGLAVRATHGARLFPHGMDSDAHGIFFLLLNGLLVLAPHAGERGNGTPRRYCAQATATAAESYRRTYAAIVDVLRARGYALLYRRRFVPTERGRIVTAFLEANFEPWIAYGFTTGMEADLDRVAEGAMAYEGVLGSFWGPFEDALGTAAGLRRDEVRATVEDALERYIFAPSPGGPVDRACPSCADGRLRLKFGRHGPFVGCPNYPECNYSRPLAAHPAASGQGSEPVALGTDPDTGLAFTLRRGRYSRYVQLGETDEDGRAPRGTVPGSMEPDEITPDVARALLAMPRTVGVHPDTGRTILAGIGLYGSWLKHGAQYVPLPDDEDVLAIGLNRAVALVDARRA